MADVFSPQRRSEIMSHIRAKGMKPEMMVRRLVHRMGYRYRLHRKDLPGKPDLVFPGKRKVIFVHGCFWHQHQSPTCKLAHKPKSNIAYWEPKLKRNQERDRQNLARLRRLGWEVLIIWECEVKDEVALAKRIKEFLDAGTSAHARVTGS